MKLPEKLENQLNKSNSMSMSLTFNTDNICNNPLLTSEDFNNNINNHFYPLCQIHKNKAYFYNNSNNKKNYFCDECMRQLNIEKFFPIPGIQKQNSIKISSCISKAQMIKTEIDRIENFLLSYKKNFEIQNSNKIEELFDYINKIIQYNHSTAKTLYNQCQKEQKNQIDKKLKELSSLKIELNQFEKQLQQLNNINNINLEKDKYLPPDKQITLNNIYTKLSNYLNYENELNLFQMKIDIKEDAKNSLFDLIQNSYEIDIDFLKMKSGEIPTVKELLDKDSTWQCQCGIFDNKVGDIICSGCTRYRKLETYNNIIFNPFKISKNELIELNNRRKHEIKVFKTLSKKDNTKGKYVYAINLEWFLEWKCFVTNDLSDKLISNYKKRISDNKLIGVLPPGYISNGKLCEKDNETGKYILKSNVKFKDDYFTINQYLWEWFMLNYMGGPEILINIQKKNEEKKNNNLIIDNKGLLDDNAKYIKQESSENNISNNVDVSSEKKFDPDGTLLMETIHKIHPVADYNFKTKFSDFNTVNNNESPVKEENDKNNKCNINKYLNKDSDNFDSLIDDLDNNDSNKDIFGINDL
jgi:hypothetical protein